jgi:hypothetical protein
VAYQLSIAQWTIAVSRKLRLLPPALERRVHFRFDGRNWVTLSARLLWYVFASGCASVNALGRK